jgi:hypothetical protein
MEKSNYYATTVAITVVVIEVTYIHEQNLILQFKSNSKVLNILLHLFKIPNETLGVLNIIVRN